jgi:branched-chain amino acid aminotransferase
VSDFVYKGENIRVGDGQVGPLAQRLFDEISAIQRGLKLDPHGWVVEIKS